MKNYRYAIAVALLIALSAMLSSCGGGSAVPAPTSSASFTGTVTDADVSGATVTLYSMKTGKAIGTGTSGTDGSYTISDIPLQNYDSDDAFFIMAEGGTVNGNSVPHLKFKSILGSKSDIDTAAGDGTVNATDIPDMTVSNVSTAKVALVEALLESSGGSAFSIEGTSALDATKITQVIQKEAEQEGENLGLVIEIASSIKAAVDNPTTGFTTTLNATNNTAVIAKNAIQVSNGIAQASNMPTDLATKARTENYSATIKADTKLMNSAAGNTSTTSISASTLSGTTWYGYHVDTWGDRTKMGPPAMFSVTMSTSTSRAASVSACSGITLTISEVSAETSQTETSTACATLNGNIITFTLSESDGSIEVVGTINATGTLINGTHTTKTTAGEAVLGGIFKIGRKASTDSFDGTYTFKGTSVALYDQNTSSTDIGQEVPISGSLTVSGTSVSGSSTNEKGEKETIQGNIEGPRIKARITSTNNTTFIVFLINESTVSGLFMSYDSVLTDPSGKPNQGGTFKMTEMTKN